jgi:uncharacterized ferritin-like protein (DUF455 family)
MGTDPESSNPPELRRSALYLLAEPDPARKAAGVTQLRSRFLQSELQLDCHTDLQAEAVLLKLPGRPAKPELVEPTLVKRRKMSSTLGRASMIAAICHIEFNAINLALDAIWRFSAMPPAFYADWLQVAQEEAYHFSLLSQHLQSLGHAYGDFPAHNGLWQLAERTRDDVLARMALVPRTMEARGLDATPAIQARLQQAGDDAAGEILAIILRDEIGHVAIGNRWYGYLCQQRGLDPLSSYPALVSQYRAPRLHPPFNLDARRAAGFCDAELAALQNQNE